MLIAPLAAAAQAPPPPVTGTLIQVWGDPGPDQPGGPRASTVIVSADGLRSTEIVLPPDLVWVREEFPQARGRRFAAIVESLGAAPAQLVVERAMYGNALGVQWAAGTNALGVRLSP